MVLDQRGFMCYVNTGASPDEQQRELDYCHAAGVYEPTSKRWHVGRVYSGHFSADVGSFELDYEEFVTPTLLCNGRPVSMTAVSGADGPVASWSAGHVTTTITFTAPSDASCDYDLQLAPSLRNRYYTAFHVTLTLQP